MFTLKIPARIHIGLLELGSSGYRMNGGIGFALSSPHFTISATPDEQCRITDLRDGSSFSKNKITYLLEMERKRSKLLRGVHITIKAGPPSHYGFGSGTAIHLGCIELLHLVNDSRLSHQQIIQASQRGGTSGVGIRTYFEGGFVFDLGRPKAGKHRPSHAWEEVKTPLQICRFDIPDWDVGICIPHHIPSLTAEQEHAIFRATTPIEQSAVHEAVYHAVSGTLGAVAAQDFEQFCAAIDAQQEGVWKRSEWNAHGPRLRALEQKLRDAGAKCVGLSSMGPSLFFLSENINELSNSFLKRHDAECTVMCTTPSNQGRAISYGTH